MKTTLNIAPELLKEAMLATGIKEKTAVIRLGLEELIKAASRSRLIALAGSMKKASAPKRNRRSHLHTTIK